MAKSMLAVRIPVIYCFNVPSSFTAGHQVNGKGYVKFVAGETPPVNMGAHCSLLTGSINHDKLPNGAETGAG